MIKNYNKFMDPQLIIEAKVAPKVERANLKIGDKIMTNGEVDGIDINYQSGKILSMREYGNLLIEFDKSFNKNLHAGFNDIGKPNHCLYVPLKNITSNNPVEIEEVIRKMEEFNKNKKERLSTIYKSGDVIIGIGNVKNRGNIDIDGEIGVIFYSLDQNNFFVGFLDKFDKNLNCDYDGLPSNKAGMSLNKINMRHASPGEISEHEKSINKIKKEVSKLGETYDINDIVIVDGSCNGIKFKKCVGIVRHHQNSGGRKRNYVIHFIERYHENLYNVNYMMDNNGYVVPGQLLRKATDEEIKQNEDKINHLKDKISDYNHNYKVGDFIIAHNCPGYGNYENLDNQIGEIVDIKGNFPRENFSVNFFTKINDYVSKRNNQHQYVMTLNRSMISVIKGDEGSEIKRKLDNKEIMIFTASDPLSMLLNRIDLKPRIVFLNMSYFDIDKDKNDMVTYMPIDRFKRLEKSDDPYKSKLRQPMKIGKFFRVLDDKLNDKQVETYINAFKANYDMLVKGLSDTLQLVSGEDVRFWYNEANYVKGGGVLNSSCMRGAHKGPEMQMFVDNPDVIQLLILRDPKSLKLLGRALVWRLEEPKGKTFMDYVYTRYDKDRELFLMYGKTRGWIIRDRGRIPTMICALHSDKKYQQGKNALDHFDTFHLVPDENYLTNGGSGKYKNPYMTKNGGNPDADKKMPEDVVVKEVEKPKVESVDKPKIELKEGDKVIYKKLRSEYDGKIATFVKIREDGKYSIVFEDGHKLATYAKYLFPADEKK